MTTWFTLVAIASKKTRAPACLTQYMEVKTFLYANISEWLGNTMPYLLKVRVQRGLPPSHGWVCQNCDVEIEVGEKYVSQRSSPRRSPRHIICAERVGIQIKQ